MSDRLGVESRSARRRWKRIGAFLFVLAAVAGIWRFGQHYLSLEALAANELALRESIRSAPLKSFFIGLGCYTLVVIVFGGQLKTIALGWLFGFLPGLLLVSFSTALAACLTLLLSRYLFADITARQIVPRTEWLQRAIARDGGQYLFIFRLIPGAPFAPVNWALGLTPLRWTTCWWATQLGMLPQIALFCLLGSRLPSLNVFVEEGFRALVDAQLLSLLAALVLLPLLLRWLIVRFRGRLAAPRKRYSSESTAAKV